MNVTARKLTRNVAAIAKKTAIQQNPIVEGIVRSRNPDGTLNIDDGRGGCLRQAPAANARIGEKIKLGLEPGLGSQTNLQQIDLTIDTSTIPCPDDQRCEKWIGMPDPCDSTGLDAVVVVDGTFDLVGWSTSYNLPGLVPGAHLWAERLGDPPFANARLDALTPGATVTAVETQAGQLQPPGFNFRDDLQCVRSYLQFDTSFLRPGMEVRSAILHVTSLGSKCNGNFPFNSAVPDPLETELFIVPSTWTGVSGNPENWNRWQRRILGTRRLAQIIDDAPCLTSGVDFQTDIPLSSDRLPAGESLTRYFNTSGGAVDSGRTRFAAIMSIDYDEHGTYATWPGDITTRASALVALDLRPDNALFTLEVQYGLPIFF